jgi:hypothetical protein
MLGLDSEQGPVYGGCTRCEVGELVHQPVDWGRSTAASGRSVMNFDTESIDGYAIPVDPMDLLQCDSCQ